MKESTNRARVIEQAMRNLQTKAFLANGGKISIEPIRLGDQAQPLRFVDQQGWEAKECAPWLKCN